MKNILILINVRWWNATAFYAINTARLLQNNNYNVYVGSKKNSPPYLKAVEYNLKTIDLNFESFNLFRLIKNFKRALKFIKENKIEIINAHRSEDHTFSALLKIFTKVKFILTRGDRRKIKNNIFSKLIYSLADKIILTSKSIYRINEKFLKPFKNKIEIIYGSADEEHFKVISNKNKTAKKYRINLKNKIVGMIGRFDYVKDQYTFVKAAGIVAQKYKNIQFILAGKEEHIKFSEILELSKIYKIENKLKIFSLLSDIADLVNLFDIAIVTSIDSETICRVALEYLYLGKAVIGTNVNVIPEIIKNNYNGIIIEPKNPEQLADAIIKLLESKSLLKKMSQNSKKLYSKYYSEKVFFKKLKRIF
jgi:glycosyltransferase involved in cell wall biosynthesis